MKKSKVLSEREKRIAITAWERGRINLTPFDNFPDCFKAHIFELCAKAAKKGGKG